MQDNVRALISARLYGYGQLKLRHYQRVCPAAAALVFLAMSFVGAAHAGNLSTPRPPTGRADPDRKVYVALGHTVFAVEPGTPLVVHRLLVGAVQKAMPPPDPRQPGGRPGNPEPVSYIPFEPPLPWAAELVRPGDPTGDPDGVWGIGVGVDPSVRAGRPDKPLKDDTTFEADLDLARRTCALPGVHEALPSGLTSCTVELPADFRSINIRNKSYVARADTYTTPLGKPFAINCLVRVHPPHESCWVRYHYAHDLIVAYNFNPVPPGAYLPIDGVIDFDRRLRNKIVQLIVVAPH